MSVSTCSLFFTYFVVILGYVCAGSEDTLTLQKWEYCAGCKLSIDHFLRMSLEAIRQSAGGDESNVEEDPWTLDLNIVISNLCEDEYFLNFVPAMTYACLKLVDEHKDALLKFNDFETLDDQRTALMPTKSNFYKIAKTICLDTAKACPKYMYPKKPIPQKERTFCKACAAAGESMEVMKAVNTHQSNPEVVENVCESLGFNHQPSAWMEDYCEEIVEDNEGAMIDILNHFDYDSRLSITTELCEGLLDCKEGKKSDL